MKPALLWQPVSTFPPRRPLQRPFKSAVVSSVLSFCFVDDDDCFRGTMQLFHDLCVRRHVFTFPVLSCHSLDSWLSEYVTATFTEHMQHIPLDFLLLSKVTENITHIWRHRILCRELKSTLHFNTTSSTWMDPREFPFGRQQYLHKVQLQNHFLCSCHTLDVIRANFRGREGPS